MTAAAFALLLEARRTGAGRWQARCPGHEDHSPSLSIREGDDGRVLLLCRVGCATAHVLRAVGLRWGDLFPGPPPPPEQQVAIERAREERDSARHHLHALHGEGCDRLHQLEALVPSVGARIMHMKDSHEADALTAQYHETLDESRRLESNLIRIERWLR
jgi:hypothetical protein